MDFGYIFIILGVLFFIAELFTADFLFASIGLACLITSVFAFLGFSLYVQLVIFSLSIIIIFATIRPFVKKFLEGKNKAKELGLNTLIGKKGKVSEKIDNTQDIGRVKIDADNWKAISETNEIIEEGESVIVTKMESITIFVKKVD